MKIYGIETCRLVTPADVIAPVFSWKLAFEGKGTRQSAYRIVVADDSGNPVWDSGEVASQETIGIEYGGEKLSSGRKYRLSVSVADEFGAWAPAASSWFVTGLYETEEWKSASFISTVETESDCDTSAFLKTVENSGEIKRIVWFVTGLGVFEAYVNGERVSKLDDSGDKVFDEMKPGFTHAYKCRFYSGYDITHLAKTGAGEKNVFSAIVTQGWWRDQPNGRRGVESAFCGVMLVEYADGTRKFLHTDTSWLGGRCGKCREAGIFIGETHDARISMEWMKTGEPGDIFSPVKINSEFKGEIRPMTGSQIRLRRDLAIAPTGAYVYSEVEGVDEEHFGKVVKSRVYDGAAELAVAAGETLIVDFGQNAAGRPELVLNAEAGTEITINVAEMLNDEMGAKSRHNDGPEASLYRTNYRAAKSEYRYIASGTGKEICLAQFTFFGYRYISVKATASVVLKSVRSIPLTSVNASMETASIETDVPLLNRLIKNGIWGQYSNYLSVPTDCPQRDERLGWAADTQVFTRTACYNADVYGFLYKWMADMRDSQHEDGAYPGVAPLAQYGNNGAAVGWADAGIIVPYMLYSMFGDKTVLTEYWDSMEKYMALIEPSHGPRPEPWGEWLAYERNDDDIKIFLASVFGVWDAMMMREMATSLGRPDCVSRYADVEKEMRRHFTENFLDPNGEVAEKYRCQAAALYCIWLDLVNGEAYDATVRYLADNIKAHGDRLQTGFLGTAIIMDALTKAGLNDVAYTLLLQRENPSWLYSIDQGATTFWERWNSYTKESGFGDAGMNSFNHYAYGAVIAWMYGTMAGIHHDPAKPGFRHILLAPKPDRRVGHVKASYDSACGLIRSEWSYGDDSSWTWNYTVPANTTATVTLPDGAVSEVGPGSYCVTLK